jgi:phage terminase small subunit
VSAALPDAVRAVWDEVRAEFLADPPKGPAFEAYCGQVAALREAERRVAAEGQVVADPKGNPIPHPGLAIARAAQAEIRAWGDRFEPPTF